jgi:hypothetical protein
MTSEDFSFAQIFNSGSPILSQHVPLVSTQCSNVKQYPSQFQALHNLLFLTRSPRKLSSTVKKELTCVHEGFAREGWTVFIPLLFSSFQRNTSAHRTHF